MINEDEPGMTAAEREILKFLGDCEVNEAAPTVNQFAQHPAPANPAKQTKTVDGLAAMIHQDLSRIEGYPKQGVKVTVYGLNPWNSMLTLASMPARSRIRPIYSAFLI
jgi:hypothetical protein